MKKKSTKKNKKNQPEVVEEVPDLTTGEKLIQQASPYASTIGLIALAGLLGFVAIVFMMRTNFDKQALEWRELSNASTIALNLGDVSALNQVATEYPEGKAGMWANQIAGDYQMRMGLQELATDRENGLALIGKAKDTFQKIIDAPPAAKSTMIQRRSQFSLAYAHESLGEFEAAKTLYEELIEQAPDSAFAPLAERGVARTSNEQFVALYDRFENWEEQMGAAPGVPVQDKPTIEFPEVDLPAGDKIKEDSEMIKPREEAAKAAAAAAAKLAAEKKAAAEKAAAEKAAMEKAEAEKKAAEEKAKEGAEAAKKAAEEEAVADSEKSDESKSEEKADEGSDEKEGDK